MQLKTSEEKYRTIVELAREGIFIVDAEDNLTFANDFLAGMLGSDPGEIIGRSVYDFMGEDARKLVMAQLQRRRRGLSDSYELTLRREDSSSLISLVSAAPLMVNGGFLGSIGIATDITYLKNVEKELRSANEFREKIIHGITDNLLVIDPHTYRIVQANNSFLGRVGLESQAVLGRTCFDVMLHRDRPCGEEGIDCPVLESAWQKKSSLSDKIYPDARGQARVLQIATYPLLDAQEEVDLVIRLERDVTDQRRIEEALSFRSRELQKTGKKKSRFSRHLYL